MAAFTLGRAFVFDGVFSCLTLGIASFFLPLALRGEAAPDYDGSPRAARRVAAYVVAGMVILAGCALELVVNAALGLVVRALVAIAVLVTSGAWRPRTRPGTNRRLLWVGPWALPIGLLVAAAAPAHCIAAMHLAYVGGFGLLAFAVAAHVTLGHTGAPEQNRRAWQVVVFGGLIVTAMILRAIATAFVRHYSVLLGAAAALWLAGAILWAAFLVQKLWRPSLPTETSP